MNFESEGKKQVIKDFIQKYWIPIVGLIVAIAVVVSLIGIFRDKEENEIVDDGYKKQSEIYIGANKLDTPNPIISASEDTYYISKLIYDGLFEFSDDFNVVPKLVDSYTVDTEKGVIEFNIKPGVSFHDGKALDIEDIKFTVNVIKSYGEEGLFYSKASKIRTVTTGDNGKIKIIFSNSEDAALDNLTFPIVSKNKSISAFINDKESVPLGTGKYKCESYDSIKELKLVVNEDYFDTKATKNVIVQFIPDKSTMANLVKVGNFTGYYQKGTQRKTDVANNNFKMYDFSSNEVDFIYFNVEKELLAEKNVRKALAYAIDIEEILKSSYLNDGVISDTVYYPNFMGIKDEDSEYKVNKDKAISLLKKSEIVDEDSNGKLEYGDETELTLNILVNSDNSNRVAASKEIQKSLTGLGFSVVVNSLPWEEYVTAISEKEYDILITGFAIEEGYDLRSFFDGSNSWGYENEELLNKAKELEKLHMSQDYPQYYEELKKGLLEELPYYSICYKNMSIIGTQTFEMNGDATFNNIYKSIDSWEWSKLEK